MKRSKYFLVALVSLMTMILAGCVSENNVEMKEFILYGDTVSISVNESWVTEELGMGYDVSVFTEDGKEGIVINQYEKVLCANSIYSMDTLKEKIEGSFGIYDLEEADNPNIPDAQNLETYRCVIPSNGVKGDGIISYFETDNAYYSIIYSALRINTEKEEYFKNVCETFKEIVPEISVQTTDTILWFNATCAILTELNGWDYTIFGGMPDYESTKSSMQENLNRLWDVIDRATAEATIDLLINEGDHVSFVIDMQHIKERGIESVPKEEWVNFILENFEVDEEKAQCYVNRYEIYKKYGDDAIVAWDYSRAMWLYGCYYIAGYYTLEEALDASLAMAEDIQNSFDSWDSFMESYFMGYEYWGDESSDERRVVYEELKAVSDSPFNVDWNLAFEKTW